MNMIRWAEVTQPSIADDAQSLSCCYEIQMFIIVFTKACSEAIWTHTTFSHITYPRTIFILSSNSRISPPSCTFLWGFPTKMLLSISHLLLRATCPAHLTFLDLIMKTTKGISSHRQRDIWNSCADGLAQSVMSSQNEFSEQVSVAVRSRLGFPVDSCVFSSLSVLEFSTLKYTTTSSFQIDTYSPFMIIFPSYLLWANSAVEIAYIND